MLLSRWANRNGAISLPKRPQTTIDVEEMDGRWYIKVNVEGRDRRALGPFKSREDARVIANEQRDRLRDEGKY
ncbi:hypothetical protein CIT26_19780 [Mesorhizobium temperatum]|uniref:DUF2188 domain-containing protein n=1 Tax=Mesorhizobium temperatum TaxID=241416 RepID=A0A271LKQ8_9HYPH|nr:hypothetical protein CIT26_19780 [Mesorhizobium temperatum]